MNTLQLFSSWTERLRNIAKWILWSSACILALVLTIDQWVAEDILIGVKRVEGLEFEPSFSAACSLPDGNVQHIYKPEKFYVWVSHNEQLIRASVTPELFSSLGEGDEVKVCERRGLLSNSHWASIPDQGSQNQRKMRQTRKPSAF